MKSFVINLGRHYEQLSGIEGDEMELRTSDTDACVKGYFVYTQEDDTVTPALHINADVLKEYFSDVTGAPINGLQVSVGVVDASEGVEYVIIEPIPSY